MTRPPIMALAAIVALGLGATASPGPDVIVSFDAPDDERVRRQRARAAERRAERERVRRAAAQRDADRITQLKAGIDPTNGQPLSRQQRRRIQQKGLPR